MHIKETMEKKYNIIYADPPWRYDMNRGQGAAENHYPTMSIQEICRLPIAELAAKDCALFLWVTFPQLQDAMKLFEAWGFTYKTLGFAWVKQNKSGKGFFFGMGYWTRSNVEICLLGIKGHPKRISKSISQLIIRLWNYLENCRELNCLQGRKHPDGMCGEMKLKVLHRPGF